MKPSNISLNIKHWRLREYLFQTLEQIRYRLTNSIISVAGELKISIRTDIDISPENYEKIIKSLNCEKFEEDKYKIDEELFIHINDLKIQIFFNNILKNEK